MDFKLRGFSKRGFGSLFALKRQEALELAGLKKAHIEATDVFASGGDTIEGSLWAESRIDPSIWPEGRIEFVHEQKTAKGYQSLRDRLQKDFRKEIAVRAASLLVTVSRVSAIERQAAQVSEFLLKARREVEARLQEIDNDLPEQKKLSKLSDGMYQSMKFLLSFLFVATEFIMTGNAFSNAIHFGFANTKLDNFLPYFLATGVLILLVAIPHYGARGLRILQYENALKESSDEGLLAVKGVPGERTYRLLLALLPVTLVGVIVSLTYFRALAASGPKWLWYLLFGSVQLALCCYFFVREWLDFGVVSSSCHEAKKQVKELSNQLAKWQKKRDHEVAKYLKISAPLYGRALGFPRLDSAIIEDFGATILDGRGILTNKFPHLAPFIEGARFPHLNDFTDIADDRGNAFSAMTNSNRTAEAPDFRGRNHLVKQISNAASRASSKAGSPVILSTVLAMEDLQLTQKYLESGFEVPTEIDKA